MALAKLAASTYCEHVLVVITAIIQLNGTRKINTDKFYIFNITQIIIIFRADPIRDLIIIIMIKWLSPIEFKLNENLNLLHT